MPPMPWIDSAKPIRPILRFDGTLGIEFTDSIKLFFSSYNTPVAEKFIVYTFSDSGVNINDPQNIKAIIPVTQNSYNFLFQTIAAEIGKVIIGVTAVSKNNIESDMSQYIILERNSSGWRITSDPANK